ncbi:MAG: glycosyltransferase [Planctomycetota bacterium]
MIALLGWGALALLGTLALWARLLQQAGRMQTERVRDLERPRDLSAWPTVTAIVPTYNEARDVEACLEALLAVDYPRLEVLVTDDGSSDDTVARVEALAARAPEGVVRVRTTARDDPRRADWTLNKSFALWTAAQEVQSDWLWFLDADVRVDPDALWRSLLACRRENALGFTCGGRYTNPSALGEALEVVMYLLLTALLPLRAIRDPGRPDASWITGQYLLIQRAAYEGLGGHAAVQGCSMDDLPLSRVAKRAGVKLLYFPGAAIFACVNYVTLAETRRNWVRLGVLAAPWLGWTADTYRGAAVALVGLGVLSPALAALAWGLAPGSLAAWLLLAQVAATLLLVLVLQASLGVRLWTALCLPVSATLATALVLQIAGALEGEVEFHGQRLTQDVPLP